MRWLGRYEDDEENTDFSIREALGINTCIIHSINKFIHILLVDTANGAIPEMTLLNLFYT